MKKTTELGAGLLEVISVIFIMGMLTFSAFTLYAKAMNNIRANYVIQQVFIKAHELDSDNFNTRTGRTGKMVDIRLTDRESKLSYGYSFDENNTQHNRAEIIVTVNGGFTEGMCSIFRDKLSSQEYAGLKEVSFLNKTMKFGEIEACESSDKPNPEKCSDPCLEIGTGDGKTEVTSMTFVIDSGFEKQ